MLGICFYLHEIFSKTVTFKSVGFMTCLSLQITNQCCCYKQLQKICCEHSISSTVILLLQTFQDIDRSPNHNEKHEILLISHIVKLKQINVTLKQSNDENDIKIRQLEKQIREFKEQNVAWMKTVDEMSSNLKILSETVNALKKELEILKDQPDQPQIPIIGVGGKLKRDVEELKSKIGNMQDKNQDFSKSIADMDLKVQLQENKTLNGELIWKIDKVDFRMTQARSGKVVVLHSAPCYTKQYEYKYCTRLYLQGDGMGRSTHVSLFFVVMKSEYDQLLTWPMQRRITFELINHVNEAESVIESFISNPRSSSFQRPANNMNVASGCPMFISIEKFLTGGFIVDNCAYIKTTVQEVD